VYRPACSSTDALLRFDDAGVPLGHQAGVSSNLEDFGIDVNHCDYFQTKCFLFETIQRLEAGMMAPMENAPAPRNTVVLDVKGLTVTLTGEGRRNRVVDGIDITVRRGEVFALLGESGSGKSMTARAIMGLIDNGDVEADTLTLRGTDLLSSPPNSTGACGVCTSAWSCRTPFPR